MPRKDKENGWVIGDEFYETVENTFNRELVSALKILHKECFFTLKNRQGHLAILCSHELGNVWLSKEISLLEVIDDEFNYGVTDEVNVKQMAELVRKTVAQVLEIVEKWEKYYDVK